MAEVQAGSRPPSVIDPIMGIVLILCGLFAFLAPMISTLATALIVAIAVAGAGMAQMIQAFGSREWKEVVLHLLVGLVFIAGSAAILLRPFIGAFAITFLLAWILLLAGGGEVALGFKIRPQRGWPWFILSGIVTIILSVWLFLRLPIAGLFVPGVALGIALILEGWAFIAASLSRAKLGRAKRRHPEPGEAHDGQGSSRLDLDA